MTVAFQQVLMAPGGFTAECFPDADLARLLRNAPDEELFHLLYWRGERLLYCYPVLTISRSAAGITLGGPGPLWHLGPSGNGKAGPLIVDREFVAGNNKLSNPTFEPDLGWLYWSRREGSALAFSSGRTGPRCVVAGDVTGSDDALVCDDPGLGPCDPGQEHHLSVWLRRPTGTGPGRYRLQARYGGRFDHPDILGGDGGMEDEGLWTDGSDILGDAAIVPYARNSHGGLGAARLGPTTKYQVLTNRSFDDEDPGDSGRLMYWNPVAGTWYRDTGTHIEGVASATVDAGGPLQKWIRSDAADDGTGLLYLIPPGRWDITGKVRSHGTDPDGTAHMHVYYRSASPHGEPDEPEPQWEHSHYLNASPPATNDDWSNLSISLEFAEEMRVRVGCVVEKHTSGIWSFDELRFDRQEGNVGVLVGEPKTVQSGRSYKVRAFVRSDAAVTKGRLVVSVGLGGVGREIIVSEALSAGPTQGEWREVIGTVDVPSGYEAWQVKLEGYDIEGGSMWVDDLTVTDADTSTFVAEVVMTTGPADWTELAFDSTAPAGTTSVKLAGVWETGADGWQADDFDIHRTDEPTTVEDMVKALLKHPRSGHQLLAEGEIIGPTVIAYDRRIRREFPSSAIHHLARSGLAGYMAEWRVNHEGLTLDFGTELFEVTDVVFSWPDVWLLGPPVVGHDAHDQASEVLVLGSQRDGRLVTGMARRTSSGPRDFWGRRIDRTAVVEDSAVDYRRFAVERAQLEMDRQGRPLEAIAVTVSDTIALGPYRCGDYVRLHDAGTRTWDPTSEQMVEGRVVFGKSLRVASHTLKPGRAGSRAELRDADGNVTDITDLVRWNDRTTADLELGDLLPDFVVDPEGGAPGRQLSRYRVSLPD